MKNRKKQFLKIGIAVLVIAVAGIVAGVVRYRIDNRFDLTVGGHTISKDEYVNCMKSVEYDTEVQIQQDYDAVYEDGFWEKKYDGKYGYEILTENTVEQLKYIHAVYDLAEECVMYQTAVMRLWKSVGKTKMQSGVKRLKMEKWSMD